MSIILIKIKRRDVSRDFLTQYYDDDDDEFFRCAKFLFSSIICADVIANKSFSTAKPI